MRQNEAKKHVFGFAPNRWSKVSFLENPLYQKDTHKKQNKPAETNSTLLLLLLSA